MTVLLLLVSLPSRADPMQPYIPSSDAQVLERLPAQTDSRARQFAQLKVRQQRQPHDVGAAVALAQAYLDYGRGSGDARYLGRAEGVLAPWLRQSTPDQRALLLHAVLLQSRHQFSDALGVLKDVLRRDPDNSQAWLTLSSVALVQGDMDTARSACAHLLGNVDDLVTAGCICSWSTANGRAATAEQVLSALLLQARKASPDLQAWGYGLVADAAKALGQTDRADAAFRKALALAPGDNFLIADDADFLLDHGRAQQALQLTTGYEQSDTSFLRKTLAEQALGLPAAKADIAQMAARFHDLELRGDSRLYGREEARFALELQHDPTRALALAKDDWANQRAPEDARIFLQAAIAAGKPAAAQSALAYVKRTHVEDPFLRELATQASERIAATSVASVSGSAGAHR